MQRFTLSILCTLFIIGAQAQSGPRAQIDVDIDVAETVIQSIMKNHIKNRFFFNEEKMVSGRYKNGYGVVFDIKSSPFNSYHGAVSLVSGTQSDDAHPIIIKDGQIDRLTTGYAWKKDTVATQQEKKENSMLTVFKEYVRDYASLFRNLSGDEKILLKNTPDRDDVHFRFPGDQSRGKMMKSITLEVKKSDVDAYTAGSISEAELESRMKIEETEKGEDKIASFEVFSSMLSSLYSESLSETYYMTSSPWYDYSEGVGVTFYGKVYSSIELGDGYSLPTLGRKVESKEERNRTVDELYPTFLDGLKKTLLGYGHVLKDLKDDEHVSLSIGLTECNPCEMPKEIEVTAQKSTIMKAFLGEISESDALSKIEVSILEKNN